MSYRKIKVFDSFEMPHRIVKDLTTKFPQNIIIPYHLHSDVVTKELFVENGETPPGYIPCKNPEDGFVPKGKDEIGDWLAENGAYPYELVIIDLSGIFNE